MDNLAERIYTPNSDDLAIFKKTAEQWGGFSNMASGYPILINEKYYIRSSEALYQALKYPFHPEIQRLIIEQHSPMSAKMVGKPYKNLIRPDFDLVKIRLMKWCVYAKLLCNYEKFSSLLLESNNKIIVEESRKDSFWGAKRTKDNKLIGANVLGRILIQARENIKTHNITDPLHPFSQLNNFQLMGEPIQILHRKQHPPISPSNIQPNFLSNLEENS